MNSLKLVARDWVKSPIEEVLWFVSKKNNLTLRFSPAAEFVRVFGSEEDLDKFRGIARKFCLVCEPFAA